MIDIHSHIIPKLDDGSKEVQETFNMLEEAEKVGFTDVIATSHYLLNYYETVSEELIFWTEKLQEVLNNNQAKIKIHSGMEIYITDQMRELINENKLLTLANSRYILIELPLSTEVKYFEHIIYFLQSTGLIPIIAHPERYKYVQDNPDVVEYYIEKGCLIQSNYGSILDLYGKNARNTLKILLKKNLVHFLGSDCHREKSVYTLIPDALKKIKKIVGKKALYEITTTNPQKILNNDIW